MARQPFDFPAQSRARSVREQQCNTFTPINSQHKVYVMKTLMIALLGMFVISLTGCNTIEGAGKDVKATGQAVEKAANDSKPK
jgi:predicted small secreted protein